MPCWRKPGFSLTYFSPSSIFCLFPFHYNPNLFISVPWDFMFLISFLVHVLHIFIALSSSYRSCYHFSIVLSILVFPDQIFFWAFLPSLFPSFLPTFCPSFPLQTLPRFSHCYEMLSRIRDWVVTSKPSISLASPWLLKRLISDCLLEHGKLSWERNITK